MTKKKTLLIIGATIIIFIGVALGIIIATSSETSEEKSTTTTSPAVYLGGFTPMIVAIALMMQPTTPVNNAISILSNKKNTKDKKIKYIDYHITKNFKVGDKYVQILELSFDKLKTSKVKEKDQERALVLAELINGESYEFEVIKRSKENSLNSSGYWVINDYNKV